MHCCYPSDITPEQFSKIEAILRSARKATRPRELDLYRIFCAILYVLKSGCQWRMLPKDFPKWSSCYYYFRLWSERKDINSRSIFEESLKKIGRGNTHYQWSRQKN